MKKFKNITLIFLMLFTLFLFVSPKVEAAGDWNDSSDFEPYELEAHVGIIMSMSEGIVIIQFTDGPAKDVAVKGPAGLFVFTSEDGYIDFENIDLWEEDLKVGYNPSTKIFNIDTFPVFDSETVFITNFDNPISTEDILDQIHAYDAEDGDISDSIEILDDLYTTYYDMLINKTYAFDTYPLTLEDSDLMNYIEISVTDSSGNESYLFIIIILKDIDAPVIDGENIYNTSQSDEIEISTIKNNLIVLDNLDWYVNNYINDDSNANIHDPIIDYSTLTVISNSYSSNFDVIGSYEIVFEAEDFSGNKSEFTVTINVTDENPPVFTGPTEIIKPQTEILLLDDILELISVTDEEDPNVNFIVINDFYTGNGHKKGSYNIILEAEDVSGNVATHTIKIIVKDNIPPVFFVDKFFINVDQYILLTREDIIELLIASGQVNIYAQTNFNFVINDYEGNEDIPGSYPITINTSSTDGTSNTINLMMNVLENTDGEDDLQVDPDKSFLREAWDWLFTPTKEGGNYYNIYNILIGLGIVFLVSGLMKSRRGYRRRY